MPEKKINDYIKAQQSQQLSLLEKLITISSESENIKGVYEVGELLRPQFEALGFKTRWIKEPDSMKRAGTLIAERSGTEGKRLLLIGHLDTVLPPNDSFQNLKKQEKMILGAGVIDDKGGLVIILYALKALNTIHGLNNATITVVLTGDEENSGKPVTISRKPLFDAAKNSDIALGFEFSTKENTATIARRGIAHWQITASGISAHSSKIFQKDMGDGAIFEMARILNSFRTQFSKENHLTLNPGILLGGTKIDYNASNSTGSATGKINIIAKTAIAKGDFRFLTPQQKHDTQAKMVKIVKEHLEKTNASIQFEESIPAMALTKANLNLLQKYSEISQSLGYGTVKPLSPDDRGAADISFIANQVEASLGGLGALGTGAHSNQEILEADSLLIQTQKAALLICHLLQKC